MTGLGCNAAIKAQGEQTRLRILRLIFKEQLSVNEIAKRLRVCRNTTFPSGCGSSGKRACWRPKSRARSGSTLCVVERPRGSIAGTVRLWEGIREDTIFVPNTFGPMQKMSEELRTPIYEPANTLVSDRYYDNLSGQQAYMCIACRVRKAVRKAERQG
jgi:hypothetical protein